MLRISLVLLFRLEGNGERGDRRWRDFVLILVIWAILGRWTMGSQSLQECQATATSTTTTSPSVLVVMPNSALTSLAHLTAALPRLPTELLTAPGKGCGRAWSGIPAATLAPEDGGKQIDSYALTTPIPSAHPHS